MEEIQSHPSSFRDPSGYIFIHKQSVFRQINLTYRDQYDFLISSGLYQNLVEREYLIPHKEVDFIPAKSPSAYKIIQPEMLPFISYPYEWCFSQLKDAALLTLKIAKAALAKNMVLKDASAYNIQFIHGKPVFIDTLSFDIYQEGKPWDGYRQFCQHFLAPLALAAHVDIRFIQSLKLFIDGIPLDFASKLLPFKTRLDFNGLGTHIHIHAGMQNSFAGQGQSSESAVQITRQMLLNIYDRLMQTVEKLTWESKNTEWGNYYQDTNYSKQAFTAKQTLIKEMIARVQPATVWDLGANNGLFSRLASEQGIFTIASDIDEAAVEKNYRSIKDSNTKNLLPLVVDLTNPSPAIGWQNAERDSLVQRSPVDLVMALALIHHLCISNNVPLEMVAALFAKLGRWAIVEFVPKEDSQVQRLLSTRKDIFDTYTQDGFELAFDIHFELISKFPIADTKRTLYLFKNRG
ncbi:MAG: SAM-dependent methyltransferase [Chloroflexi bacterium HGW-Chloroflexi-10]|nr:MAG: SAM-dependent methyltransferase [Chloroflexi bacterium HGW-Chloroflexi-10]